MRAVVQRIRKGKVLIEEHEERKVGKGMVVYVGVGVNDVPKDAYYLAKKVANLRIFDDPKGKMNLSLGQIGGSVLAIPQFTLQGDCRRSNRPSFTGAASYDKGLKLFNKFVDEIRKFGFKCITGEFQTNMVVKVENDGPITILLDSKRLF